jgi:hypothetical protein
MLLTFFSRYRTDGYVIGDIRFPSNQILIDTKQTKFYHTFPFSTRVLRRYIRPFDLVRQLSMVLVQSITISRCAFQLQAVAVGLKS